MHSKYSAGRHHYLSTLGGTVWHPRRPAPEGSRAMFFLSASPQDTCRTALWHGFAGHVMLPWALQGLEPHGQLLELGSGSAAMAPGTAARFPEVQVTATDLDPEMVRAAAARLARYRNAAAEQADVVGLPFAHRSLRPGGCRSPTARSTWWPAS